jgi:hypothetical protein
MGKTWTLHDVIRFDALRKTIYDKVASRREKLGLPGQIPRVAAFETSNSVTYHELGGFEPGHKRTSKEAVRKNAKRTKGK